ncbi:MAG: hypothetical protein IJJ61_09910 [Clostridia bacterium]|nr:hypothetical protein [Clostridia bacterium]
MNLNSKSQALYDAMWKMPPDYDEIKAEIDKNKMSPEEITNAAIMFIDKACEEEDSRECTLSECFWNDCAFTESFHSAYLPELMSFLFENGLDLNLLGKSGSTLYSILYLENGYVAADTFRVLFENGLDIYTADDDGETLFESIDFDIIFGMIEQHNRKRYDVWFHTWLVFVGYGAEPENGTSPVDIVYQEDENEEFNLKDFEISDFRDHHNFDFVISNVINKGESPSVIIFDKRTRYEVARL